MSERFTSNPADLEPGTLVGLFLHAIALDRPNAQMRRGTDGWEEISHQQILAKVQAISASLRAHGCERGDRIAILAENRPEWAWADYAALCTGCLTVPVYPTLPAAQAAFILRHSGARLLFVSTQEQLEKVREVRAELPSLERVVMMDAVQADDWVSGLDAFLDEGRAGAPDRAAFEAEARRAQPDDVATLVYTSGTTGEPKGVMLTHNNIYSNVVASTMHVLSTTESDVALSFLPLSHVFQRMVDYTIFASGTPIAYVAVMDHVVQALGEVRPTIVCAVPRVYEKIYAKILSAGGVKRRLVLWARQVALDYADAKLNSRPIGSALRVQHAIADRLVFSKVRATLGGRIRFFVSGAAPLSAQISQFFYGAGVLILEGYGLTETSPVTNVNQPDAMRPGTVGRAVPGTEIRLADDDEILIRGPQVMKGYYNNEKATREVIDDDGWFHTGDIGRIDSDGFLYITDRKKELLVTAGGKNIAPQPIQNATKLSRFVSESLLVGDRRPYPILLVVPNFDSLHRWAREAGVNAADDAALVADARVVRKIEEEVEARLGEFARYERPKKVLVLPREFSLERGEVTPSLKIKRRVVEQAYEKQIEALYAVPSPE